VNLSQLVVKLQIDGVKALEKVVKELQKAGLVGGSKPGVPGQGGGQSGPATQAKLVKMLGAEYEKYAKIVKELNDKEQKATTAKVRGAQIITDEIKKQIQAIDALEQQANAATTAFDKMLATDKIDEAREAVKKLNEELAKTGEASGGGAGKWGRFGGPVGAGFAIAGAGAIGADYGYQMSTQHFGDASAQYRGMGGYFNAARRGDLAAQVLLGDLSRGQDGQALDSKVKWAQRKALLTAAFRTVTPILSGEAPTLEPMVDALDVVINPNNPTGLKARIRKEETAKGAAEFDAANQAKFEAIRELTLNAGYERRLGGFYGGNKYAEQARILAKITGVPEDAIMSMNSGLVGAQGRGGAWLGQIAARAVAGGMDQGAVMSMLSAGPLAANLFGAVNRTGFYIAAAEKVGMAAASYTGNPLFNLSDPSALVAMLGSGLTGLGSMDQNRMAAQNQIGLQNYANTMVGGDAWGQTAAFINANAAGSGLSFYGKNALAELATDPGKLAALQAAVYSGKDYKVSGSMDALGITSDMAKDWFMRQQETQLSRFMDDPSLAGTKAGERLAAAREAGGLGLYLQGLSGKEKGRAIMELGGLTSQALGGAAGLAGGDEAAMAFLRVQAPELLSGKGVTGTPDATDPTKASSAVGAAISSAAARLNDFNGAIDTVTKNVIETAKKFEAAWQQQSNPSYVMRVTR
jgi:hypothetical protein